MKKKIYGLVHVVDNTVNSVHVCKCMYIVQYRLPKIKKFDIYFIVKQWLYCLYDDSPCLLTPVFVIRATPKMLSRKFGLIYISYISYIVQKRKILLKKRKQFRENTKIYLLVETLVDKYDKRAREPKSILVVKEGR